MYTKLYLLDIINVNKYKKLKNKIKMQYINIYIIDVLRAIFDAAEC